MYVNIQYNFDNNTCQVIFFLIKANKILFLLKSYFNFHDKYNRVSLFRY